MNWRCWAIALIASGLVGCGIGRVVTAPVRYVFFSDRQTARCIAQIKAIIDERAIPSCRKQAIGKIFAVNSEVCERYAVSGGETGARQARSRF